MKIKGIIYAAGTILMAGCVLYLSVTTDQPLFMYTSAIETSLAISNDKMIGACSVTGYHGQVIKVAAYHKVMQYEVIQTYSNNVVYGGSNGWVYK